MQQVVNLTFHRTHLDLRINQPRRPDDLLYHHTRRLGELIRAWSCRHIHQLIRAVLPLLKGQRTVIQSRGHAEAVLDQRLLARAVAGVHAAQLRHRLVRLVDEHQEVARKIIQQRGRRLTGEPTRKVARVILDAMAVAHGLDHLQIKHSALVNALCFYHPALLLQFHFPPPQLFPDRIDRRGPRLFLHHVVSFGIDRQPHILLLHRAK